jgi:hypothetical protein
VRDFTVAAHGQEQPPVRHTVEAAGTRQ